MNRFIKAFALQFPPIRSLYEQRNALLETSKELADKNRDLTRQIEHTRLALEQLYGDRSKTFLQLLPGTEWSRYAIPLEYQPSRSFTPRYGGSHPPIAALAHWFDQNQSAYKQFLDFMYQLPIQHIPIEISPGSPLAPAWVGGAITAFDCLALYAMVQKHKPRLYMEIGSGMTTCFARQAVMDRQLTTKIVSIDPEPRREIDSICDEIIRDALESFDLSRFEQLEAGDILFLDGSHRTFMNSDVTVFFIDVLPRLKPGVIVHIHDILLPWDYPESFKYWYWNEQYMLAVYMMNAMDRLIPLLPTAWISRSTEFNNYFKQPPLDLGSDAKNESWKNGGSMWFTKSA